MLRILIVLLSLLSGVLPPSTARAHAVLMSTEPADGVTLTAAPARIVLRFNEPVIPIAVHLIDGAGTSVIDARHIRALDHNIEVVPPGHLADGTYLLSYRVTSADSHPVAGSFLFSVGASPEPGRTAIGDMAEPTDWSLPVAVNRVLLLTAVLLAAGGSFFLIVIAAGAERDRQALRPLIGTAAVVVIATATLAVGLQGALLSGTPFSTLLDPATWRLGLSTTRSSQSLALMAGSGLILGGLGRRGPHPWLLGAGAAAMAASFALSGHMATATPRWILLPVLVVHVAIAAFWLGSLAPLLSCLGEGQTRATERVRRFSAVAGFAVPVLIGAGIVLGCVGVVEPIALTGTAYGRLLTTKAALVTILLGLAAVNRHCLLPRLQCEFPRMRNLLRSTIRAEIALGLAIVLATVTLSQTPHHGPTSHAELVHRHGHETPSNVSGRTIVVPHGGWLGILQVTHTPTAAYRVELTVIGERGEVATIASEATLFLSNSSHGVEPVRRPMVQDGPARFHHQGPEMTLPGLWRVRADVLFGTFDMVSFETTISLP